MASSTSSRFRASGVTAHVAAVALMAAAILLTRLTWPVFARAPFVLMFGAVYLVARWGSRDAGWLTVALGAFGAPLFAGPPGAIQFGWASVAVFIAIGGLANHLISSRNQAMAALAASEAELRATWEHGALGVALVTRTGRVERVNPAMIRILGYPSEAWVGAMFNHCAEPVAGSEQQRFVELMTGGKPHYQREGRYRRQDGSWIWARVTISAIAAAGRTPTGAVMVLEDVTARRQGEADLRAAEQKLRQAQKMEAVGQLVAGVAHNFNNLLTITMGYTDLLLSAHGPDSPDRPALEEIRKATSRGAGLTRQLLTFSRQRESAGALVDLNGVLRGMRGMLTRVIREDIVLTVNESATPATVVMDTQDLEQAVLNLVINARDALPGGGHVAIDVTRQQFDAGTIPADLGLLPGDYVRVSVRDDGVGMSAEVQRHLFEPFFTTKEVNEGTGLGLATVYGIVRRHHGGIRIVSAPGAGTTVTLFFPFAEQGSAVASASA